MSVAFVDLASDTKTRPTPGMRRAMAEAEVGDEQAFEDPTVNALCERVAGLLGKEAPDFVALPALPVSKENLLDAWKTVYRAEASDKIKDSM